MLQTNMKNIEEDHQNKIGELLSQKSDGLENIKIVDKLQKDVEKFRSEFEKSKNMNYELTTENGKLLNQMNHLNEKLQNSFEAKAILEKQNFEGSENLKVFEKLQKRS